jgi:Ribbon-helix-helix protein, copG family
MTTILSTPGTSHRDLLNNRARGKRRFEMADKVRLNLQLSQELNKTLDEISESTGSNRTDVIRQALALMKVAHEAKRKGKHLGLVSDADKLDTEIVGLL